jgi:holin-like protein
MLRGLAVVLSFTALGYVLETFARVPLPGAVLGLVAFVIALRAKLVSRETVREACAALTSRMALFLVPASVAVFWQGDLVRAHLVAIVVASTVSALLVFAVVGLVGQRMVGR